MASSGWQRHFDDPIPLPRGRELITLKAAADYIMKLPKAEQNLEEWQTAIHCLIGAAEGRDFLLHARVGMLRALNRNVERVFNPDRKARIGDGGSWCGIDEIEADARPTIMRAAVRPAACFRQLTKPAAALTSFARILTLH
jgi:hypothetical protein